MPRGEGKIGKVLGEFKRGTLHSSAGPLVRKRSQAIAIALSEARRAGANIPRRRIAEDRQRRMKRAET